MKQYKQITWIEKYKKMKLQLLILVFSTFILQSNAQNFTRKDSLRGGFPIERTCFDVQKYNLNIILNIDKKMISGFNEINFIVKSKTKKIQLDLFQNMTIDSIVYEKKQLKYKREFDAVFVFFDTEQLANKASSLKVYYQGVPTVAKNAPWDGGFVWKKDSNQKDFIGVACQGDGASLWFPCKDTQSDEPDFGATIKINVPNGLTAISNGRFKGSNDLKNGTTTWEWEVKSPINNYDITMYIGDYVHFGENYKGLDLDFYALKENESKARNQFEEVKPMLDCFQEKFGKYPFAEDGYKLVETNYLGMEHQSAVAYGNHYSKGYLGSDLSGTGVGLLFDFIIIHESGHEWFGNSITSRDVADMWIHEGFTCYTETVYLECNYGYDKSQIYINGLRKNILNDRPIIGYFGVSNEGSGDMYYKGALMLNTLRHTINNNDLWWKLLKKYSETFRHKIITAEDVITFFNAETKLNLTPIFNQYLKHTKYPILEIRKTKSGYDFRWKADEPNFEMTIYLPQKIEITNNWKNYNTKIDKSIIEKLKNMYLIEVRKY